MHFILAVWLNSVWLAENPHVVLKKALNAQRVTVWCGCFVVKVIWPHLKDNAGNSVTVNGERYNNVITEFLWPLLDDMYLYAMWFQQDEVTWNIAGETTQLLHETFTNRVILRAADQNWPDSAIKHSATLFCGILQNLTSMRADQNNLCTERRIERIIHEIEVVDWNREGCLVYVLFHI